MGGRCGSERREGAEVVISEPLSPWRGSGALDLSFGGTSLALLLRRASEARAARPRWYHRLSDYINDRFLYRIFGA